MDAGEEVRPAGEQGVVVDQGNPRGGGEGADRGIDLGGYAPRRFKREGEGRIPGDGRDRREKDLGRAAGPVRKCPEHRQDLPHVDCEGVRLSVVAVDPDVIRSELEKDEIGPLLFQPRPVLFQEQAVFAGRVPAPAKIEDFGPDPFPVEELLEKMGIRFGGDAVPRAEDDDPAGGRGTEGEEKRHQENEGMPAQPYLHGRIISPSTGTRQVKEGRTQNPVPGGSPREMGTPTARFVQLGTIQAVGVPISRTVGVPISRARASGQDFVSPN